MSSNGDKLNTIVKAEGLRVLLSLSNIIAIIGATWLVSTHLSDIKHDVADFRSFKTEFIEGRNQDRAQMKDLGDKLVAAINRITAIEARTDARSERRN